MATQEINLPAEVPAGDPQAKAEAKARAEFHRFEFGQIKFQSDINVSTGDGLDRQTQTISQAGSVRKPTAVGAL